MRGKVLGFDHERGGVILGEGDRRLTFTMAGWRDPKPPQRGMSVDFVERDGTADEIYVALGALSGLAVGGGAGAAGGELKELIGRAGQNGAVANVFARLRAFPQIALAVLILFACVFMNYARFGTDSIALQESGMSGGPQRTSLVSFNGALAPLRAQNAIAADQVDVMISNARAVPVPGGGIRESERDRALSEAASAVGSFGLLLTLAHLLWLIPLLALGVALLHWFGRHALAMLCGLALGAVSLFAGLFPSLWEAQVIAAFPDPRVARGQISIDAAFGLETGGWLILLGGIGCAVLAVLRRRPVPSQTPSHG